MPTREEITYFGAGPAGLPTSVLARASEALYNYQNTGLGLVEHSHRSALADGIISRAIDSLKSLLAIPDDYEVIFMQGGGTSQFSAAMYNLMGYWVQTQLEASSNDLEAVRSKLKEAKIDLVVTGSWSQKARDEVIRLAGKDLVHTATDSKKEFGKYCSITEESQWNLTKKENNIFSYYCDNETVDGVEFPAFPTALADGRLVATDMSSNILSRKVDVSKYAVLFAGAQKNIGSAGLTIVIVRKAVLEKQPSVDTLRTLGLPIPPIMMSYPPIAKNKSLYNTLPIMDVYVAGEVMAELVARGGLDVQQKIAEQKAELLYNAVDANTKLFHIVSKAPYRSRMNICFRIQATGGNDGSVDPGLDGQGKNEGKTVDLEKEFLAGAEQRGLTGLKGHRSVGGIRISNYNSIRLEAAQALTEYIKEFSQKHS